MLLWPQYQTVFVYLLCTLICLALSPLPVDATESFDSLYAAIEAANSGSGINTIELSEDIILNAALPPIRDNITIDGNGHTISGADQFRIFDVDGGVLAIMNLTLTNGSSAEGNGAAIRLLDGAQVTLSNTTLENNSAEYGGAIAISSGATILTIHDSSFLGNIAEKSAGAIYADGGAVNIINSNFVKNCAESVTKILNAYGGTAADREDRSVDADGCLHLTYYRSSLEANIEEGDGGAIRLLNGATATIDSSAFKDNKATNGGAIAASSSNVQLTVTKSSFRENSVSGSAGSIYAVRGTTSVTKSSFVQNSAEYGGGAMSAGNTTLDIANSTFSENQTESGAGALEIGGSAEVTITHATFLNNWSLYRDSGAIEKMSSAKVYLRNSIIASRGRAEDCVGGLDQNVGNLSVDGTCGIKASQDPLLGDLAGSPAYHAPLDHSPALDAADSEYCLETDQLGTARPQGGGCDSGAIESTTAELAPEPIIPPPTCTLADQIIAANMDRESEGCPAGNGADTIVLSRDILLFSPLPAITSFITIKGDGHTISGDGKFRIFDVDRGFLTINNLTMVDGRASSGRGGAIRLQNGGRATVNDSHFIGNAADVGGAVAVDSSSGTFERLTVYNSSFVENRASRTGGAINLNFGSASVTNSSFIENLAGHSGGAINLLNFPRIDVTNSSFMGNRADWDGGALAVENGATATLTHVTVYNNVRRGSGSAIHLHDSSYGSANKVNLRNSIIAGSGYLAHCFGDLSQNIGNLIVGGSCSPMLSDDPLLEEFTSAKSYLGLLDGSPAIGAADPRFCLDTDQIGRTRPIVGRCDIGAIESVPVSQALSDCAITTTHVLNLRDEPNGNIVGGVSNNATLTPVARTPGWFQVEKEGTSGWISAYYVTAQGVCAQS